jgi:hypothetical protein
MKAGMHVNGNGEVIGWVEDATSVELREGDVIVKSLVIAKRMNLEQQWNELKPKKVRPVRASRATSPTSGVYSVLSKKMVENNTPRGQWAKALKENTKLEDFLAAVPHEISVTGRDGSVKQQKVEPFISYVIRRKMISLD